MTRAAEVLAASRDAAADLLYLPPRAEPFTTYLWWDIIRVAISAAALWLGVLVLRLAWTKIASWRHGYAANSMHPATYVSYGLGMIAIGGLRAASVGTAPDVRMLISAVIVVLGLWGVLRRVEFNSPLYRFAKVILAASARAGRDAGRDHLRDERERRDAARR